MDMFPQAKINATRAGGSGKTALHCAAEGGFLKICTTLLERGANPFKKDGAGKMPLHYAKIKRFKNVTQVLKDVMAEKAAGVRGTAAPAKG
jgi:ankyrin repeat protein